MFLNDEQKSLAEEIATLLTDRGEKVAVSEATAGGLISAALLWVAGASKYYAGGGVVYTLASRTALAGVPAERYADYRAFIGRIRGAINGILDNPPPDFTDLGDRGNLWQLMQRGLRVWRLGKRDAMELFRIAPMAVRGANGELVGRQQKADLLIRRAINHQRHDLHRVDVQVLEDGVADMTK